MSNNLTNKISEEMILKKGEKLQVEHIDPSSPRVIEMLRRVHEEQVRIINLKYKKFENLEVYIPPSHHNYR
jgi:hypothetical protein